ncbi:hypothetical protein Pint_36325 [Pistacia integerrima]|uniref:Uncharacterized protein n=1 Tax=Pistacia integerrima TaxID=434235 RepID=A0ACC0Y2Z8_9ROSI|nr:hypothetical protein Pint_36325 [Pistacia integerrima]
MAMETGFPCPRKQVNRQLLVLF